MQVRRPDLVFFGTDFWQKGVYRVQTNPDKTANALVPHLNCPSCIRRFDAAGSVTKPLTGPVKTLTRVIYLTLAPAEECSLSLCM